MREGNLIQSKSKRNLLDAAEKLFADRGFDAVSVRDITQLAKANVAAVNYHFGGRDGLIAVLVTRYITPVYEERTARLDNLEKKWAGKAVPVEEIIDAYVRPLITLVRKSELSERLFCKLIGRIFSMQAKGIPHEVNEQFRVQSERFTRAFAKALPTVGPEDLAWRIHFMIGAMIHMLMQQEMLQRSTKGDIASPGMEATLAKLVRFVAAGLREGVEQPPGANTSPQATFNF